MKKITLLLFIFCNFLTANAQTPVSFYPTSPSGFNFGSKIASNNSDVLVSSSSLNGQIGKVFLFNSDSGSMSQTNVFYPDDAVSTDLFGRSLSINNEFIAVGSPFHDANFTDSGAVYIYRKIAGTWTFLQKIMAGNAIANDQFGTFVKFHNNQLFISSINYDNGNSNPTSNKGTVYVYNFNGTQWAINQTLTTDFTYKFGEKIEFENDKLVVLSKENATDYSIKLHTYTYNGTTWTPVNSTQSLGSLEEKITDFSLSGNQLFVLSTVLNPVPNKVSIYDVNGTNWNFSSTLSLANFPEQKFTKIEVSGENMIIGSTEYTLQMERKFPLLHYRKVSGNWTTQNTFYGNGATNNDDQFGSQIDLSGNNLIIGAPTEGIISYGKAYYLDLLLGKREFETAKIIAYPNPTKDFVYFQNDNLQRINSVDVYSITGKLLFSKNENSDKISLQNVATGIYFLKINFENNYSQTLKISKE